VRATVPREAAILAYWARLARCTWALNLYPCIMRRSRPRDAVAKLVWETVKRRIPMVKPLVRKMLKDS